MKSISKRLCSINWKRPLAAAFALSLTCHAAIAQLGNSRAISDAEMLQFGKRLAAKIASDPAAANSMFDWRELIDRGLGGLNIPRAARADFARDLGDPDNKINLLGELQRNVKAGGSYQVVGIRQTGTGTDKRRLVMRLTLPGGGFNYHELELHRDLLGTIRSADFYVHFSGEMMSQTLRRLILPAVPGKKELWETQYVANIKRINEMNMHRMQGEPEKGLAIYKTLPDALRNSRPMLLTRIQLAQAVKNPLIQSMEFEAALKALVLNLDDKNLVALFEIDYMITQKKYDRALDAINRLDKRVDDPSWLNFQRAMTYLLDNKRATALATLRLAFDAGLDDRIAWEAFEELSLQEKSHSDTAEAIGYMHARFQDPIGKLTTEPRYAAFVRSNKYRELLADKNLVEQLRNATTSAEKVKAIKQIGAQGKVASLCVISLIDMLGDTNLFVRLDARRAIGEFGNTALKFVKKACDHSDAKVRENAAYAIWHIINVEQAASEELEDFLLTMVHTDESAQVRGRTLRVFGAINTTTKRPGYIVSQLKPRLEDKISGVKTDALVVIRNLVDTHQLQLTEKNTLRLVVPKIMRCANDVDAVTRVEALACLRFFGDLAEPAKALVAIKMFDSKAAASAARTYIELGGDQKKALDTLKRTIADDPKDDSIKKQQRKLAVRFLGDVKAHADTVVPVLVNLLSDKELQAEALTALGNLGIKAQAASSSLVELMDGATSKHHKARIVLALAQIDPKQAKLPAWIDSLANDSSWFVKARMATAIGAADLTDVDRMRYLQKLVKDTDYLVRTNALEQLGKLGNDPQRRKLIEQAKNDRSPSVRLAARKALAELENAPAKKVVDKKTQMRQEAQDFWAKDQPQDAARVYRSILKLYPGDLDTLNSLSWLYSTSPDDDFRDANEAIQYGRQACDASLYDNLACVDTLAAAYAEAGDFEKAIILQKRVVETHRKVTFDLVMSRYRLMMYQAKQPWREHYRPGTSSPFVPTSQVIAKLMDLYEAKLFPFLQPEKNNAWVVQELKAQGTSFVVTHRQAKSWWQEFKKINADKPTLVTKLADALVKKEMSGVAFFLAHRAAGEGKVQDALDYYDKAQKTQSIDPATEPAVPSNQDKKLVRIPDRNSA